jgi:hypothetical protein
MPVSLSRTWRRLSPLAAAIIALSVALVLPPAEADHAPSTIAEPLPSEPEVARGAVIEVADAASLSLLASRGVDLAHWNEPTEQGTVRSVAFATAEDLALFEEMGVRVLEVTDLPTTEDLAAQRMGNVDGVEVRERTNAGRGRGQGSAGKPAPVDEAGALRVLRADTFTSYAGDFVSFEVRSANGRTDAVTVTYLDGGQPTTRTLAPFVDAGQYLYHRTPRAVLVDGAPTEVTIRSADGTELTTAVEPWATYDTVGYPEGFDWGFITTGYPDAVDSTNRIEALAAEFPELAEIIELPYETHGYRRPAMHLYGGFTNTVVNVESIAYGHEGGNDLTFEIRNDGTPNRALEVTRDGDDVTVLTATDGSGGATSTAAQVVAAINASPATAGVMRAFTYRGNAGLGTAETTRGRAQLSDFLSAPEDKISREPQTVKAIRIGATRDGSKTGVFAYSQEHAREWVTPVVTLEAAERLLRNYGSDADSTRYVDELDIFIIPTVNPDGTNYSLYDNFRQRRNMNNHCGDNLSDALARNAWGVDLNRNFRVGTIWDGYAGASLSCTSDVFAGPEPGSEAEIRNELWLIDTFDNIRFSMNIHTFGGYFMWAPGAYKADGRVPLERPSVGIEEYFFDASQTILGKIAEHRGTVVEPTRTGPIIDVLYSAAGNSADDVWYSSVEQGRPIFAWNFEAGADRYTGAGASGWQSPGQFWPDFADEGFDQAMEFANGVYGLLEVATQFADDDVAPTSRVNVTNGGWYDGPVDVEWTTSEPATIYYTTDGSRPTYDSPILERRDARDSAAPVRIERSTTLRWFAVDAAGNVEGGYDPDGRGRNHRTAQIRIR